MNFMDPENFTIEQKKEFQMWPDASIPSVSIMPYIKRIRKDAIRVFIVGDVRGESTFDILESVRKVELITVLNSSSELTELFDKNTEKHKDRISTKVLESPVDCVIVCDNICTPENLETAYEACLSGGIFCGNGHETQKVKTSLNTFRRKVKIGIPISISNRTTWFWIKR